MTETCPIWKTPAKHTATTRDGSIFDSHRSGGRYFISRHAEINLKSADEKERIKLTNWIVDQHCLGVDCPEIKAHNLDEIMRGRHLTANERADRLLRYLDAKSDLLGHVIKFYELDNSKVQNTEHELFAWTSSVKISEVITLAEYCDEQRWIEHRMIERSTSRNNIHEIMLRPPGYTRLAELDGTNSSSIQAFVAMWFDASMAEIYEKGIARAIKDAGYEPIRIDRKDHNNKIDDEIIAEIRRSRFLVADFTQGESGARGGVYYEAGFAHGLNIPVIFTCKADTINKVHFDTRQYNHITWETPEELRTRLAQRISATIGDGPL